jgi:hypothetical protein
MVDMVNVTSPFITHNNTHPTIKEFELCYTVLQKIALLGEWKVLIPWMDFFISQLGWISTIARTEWSTEDLIRVRFNRLIG